MSSGFTYGVVHLDNPRADLIVEFLVGSRLNKDGETGQSSQLQAGGIVKFSPPSDW